MDKDLKDTIRKLEEAKRKQERLEKTIIILSGLLIIIVFTVIGINLYSGKNEKISEPEINIVNEKPPKPVEKEPEKVLADAGKSNQKPKSIEEAVKKKEQEKKKEKVAEKKKNSNNSITGKEERKKVQAEKKEKPKVVIKKKPEKIKKKKESVKEFPGPVEKGFYYIQVGAFTSEKNVKKAMKSYKVPSQHFYVLKTGKLYKLMVGKFKTRKEALEFMRKYGFKGILKKL